MGTRAKVLGEKAVYLEKRRKININHAVKLVYKKWKIEKGSIDVKRKMFTDLEHSKYSIMIVLATWLTT